MIEHLRGRDRKLEPLGWTGQDAEWIALVCLHSGVFTRARIASCAMQGGGELPWEVTCRGVVDGIAMVIHMTRHEGRRFVEEALFVQGYETAKNRWFVHPVWPLPGDTDPPGEPSQAGTGS